MTEQSALPSGRHQREKQSPPIGGFRFSTVINMTKRLSILKESLAKKKAAADSKIAAHFESVKETNGQPLNDKRNGAATFRKWAKQDTAIRTALEGVQKTKDAIEREESAIARVESVALPSFILEALAAGELTQWRKHPNRFFVPGVDKGRIVWNEAKGVLMHSHLADVPKDQYPKFRDTFNRLRQASL